MRSTVVSHAWRKRATGTPSALTPDWELLRDFETGTIGTLAEGSDAFSSGAGNSVYTADQVYAGSKAGKLSITAGAYNGIGGTLNLPSPFFRYDVLWLDLQFYIPDTFVISTNTGSLKTLRATCLTAADANEGTVDTQFRNDAFSDYLMRTLKEGQDVWYPSGLTGPFPRNTWKRISWYIAFDTIAANNGGQGCVKLWLDGALIGDHRDITPLLAATSRCNRFLLFDYWNGSAPQTQSCYVDNIRLAKNGRPAWVLDLEDVP